MTSDTKEKFVWQWQQTHLVFLKEKALWLEEEKSLLVADTHFGKAGHFRKSGIPIPETVHDQDFRQLQQLIDTYKPLRFLFLGDLFHSEHNLSWEQLLQFVEFNDTVSFHLVKGNHDILPRRMYENSYFRIHEDTLTLGKLLLTHEPLAGVPKGFLNVCGHLHPGVVIQGKSRQRITLPCFFYRNNCLVLPAFGRFTGLMKISRETASCILVTTSDAVIPIKLNNKVG
ncbi:putative phosphoesterase, SbcD/Mre11-related/metallophosphoesterase, DNA ligase-associated [Cyclobacterium xiamenense]|uniref:Putative phosphoesterase, SbcD/Mre11-related/metallophosphoesterase, DNA ligase-associated n=1 Tax=Cyclobacterium xiamenense TaxID=1297121 RepID=A0A1H7BW61_9BACT|nr:ligase-associated DNA damage response endonuclease PdeM [Cyclobacterium xiamenense]SEJ78942.1 putative phosphoesterase, SbcD/Mre11-related/metallophosphoesterase, DNA ligase-associated [Cyclobacterium xiamenense]